MRIGTRGSALALAQARSVAALVDGAELVTIATAGDRGEAGGDKSRWVSELERALLADEIDIAVHSAKDLPADLPEGLAIAGVPPREDPRDALCGAPSLADLPAGARVGTSSLRRRAQLAALRPELEVVPLRGNVDTRLRRLEEGACDALVLAAAGLRRLGREDAAGALLDELVPCAGQGALALETRADDEAAAAACGALDDRDAARCLAAERALVRALGASCHTPLGAHARLAGAELELQSFLGLPDGGAWLTDSHCGPAEDPEAVGTAAAERLLAAGAAELLRAAEEQAAT